MFELSGKQTTFYLLLCVLSFLFVTIAPSTYSYDYVLLIHCLYIVTAIISVYHNKGTGYINFHMVFTVSYYFVNFVYPVFYYPTSDRYFGLFSYAFDEKLISKCTALAYFAYCTYLCGFFSYKYRYNHNKINKEVKFAPTERITIIATVLLIISFILFLLTGGLEAFSIQYQEADHANGISSYFFELVYCFSLVVTITSFYSKKQNVFPLAVVFAINFMVLMTGFRTFTICWIIIFMALYNERVKRISLPVLLALAIVGTLFFNTIRIVRSQDFNVETVYEASKNQMEGNTNESNNPFLDNAWDLTINNRSLYYLVGYADNNGYTYGVTLLGGILGVIPIGQTLFVSFTGIPTYLLGSATFNTVKSAGPWSPIGLGTNSVADLYLSFGIIGVIFGFYFMGRLLGICYDRKNVSMYYSIAYYCLIYRALFIPRSSVFMSLRVVVWTMVIYYLINKFINNKRVALK